MKKMKNFIKYFILVLILSVGFQSCNFDFYPTDQMSSGSISDSPDGIRNVTNGNYALFKDGAEFNGFVDLNNCYLRQYFQLSDFSSDDVVCGQITEDPFFYSFTYTHSPAQSNTKFFWYMSYKIISGANTVIEILNLKDHLSDEEKQLLGENYFLRAIAHFNLLKFFAKPYTHSDPNTNLGVIIRESTSEDGQKARASVKECYDFIETDLKTAADLMNNPRGVEFASKEAAWALLSRLYLYKEDHDNTILYADSVINSGKFSLETVNSYPSLFPNAQAASEPIFLIALTSSDNRGKFGSIASMYYSDGNSGWGEEFASPTLQELMANHTEDIRWSYIDTLFAEDGVTQSKKNGLYVYWITKFSFQDGDPNLSSPVLLRFSEMYLNKAEAYAKQNNPTEAFNNINEIRRNRGLEGALITEVPAGKTLLDIVLDERRIELAFEGHRTTDLFRNKRNVERTYWGYHLPGITIADINLATDPSGYSNLIINWDSPRNVYYIPVDEILANNLCVQNP